MKQLVLFGVMFLAIVFVGCGENDSGERRSGDDVAPTAPSYAQRQGAVLFAHYCAPCHGTEGAGDGFNAFNLEPKPRDLTSREFQANRSDEDLIAVVRLGGRATELSSSMPAWSHTLNERQIASVVSFVRALEADESAQGETQ